MIDSPLRAAGRLRRRLRAHVRDRAARRGAGLVAARPRRRAPRAGRAGASGPRSRRAPRWPGRSGRHATPRRRPAGSPRSRAASRRPSSAATPAWRWRSTRYTALTAGAARAPGRALVLWPETVITDDLTPRPGAARALRRAGARPARHALRRRLHRRRRRRSRTRSSSSTRAPTRSTRRRVYVKEQLVPFVEYVPGPAWLRALPARRAHRRPDPGPQRGRDARRRDAADLLGVGLRRHRARPAAGRPDAVPDRDRRRVVRHHPGPLRARPGGDAAGGRDRPLGAARGRRPGSAGSSRPTARWTRRTAVSSVADHRGRRGRPAGAGAVRPARPDAGRLGARRWSCCCRSCAGGGAASVSWRAAAGAGRAGVPGLGRLRDRAGRQRHHPAARRDPVDARPRQGLRPAHRRPRRGRSTTTRRR